MGSKVDVIIGYRADDSYFKYADSFVSNSLSLRGLNRALRLGKLGEQTVVISEKGFTHLKFIEAFAADKSIYYPRFLSRDSKAREAFREEMKKENFREDIFILDILREEMSNDDPRIQRIVSE